MTTAIARRLEKEVKALRRDVTILKAAVLAHDPEGEYRPEFVHQVRRLAKQKPSRIYWKGVFAKR